MQKQKNRPLNYSFSLPIIQAPMAGGITSPELVATVSNTGALGSLGAGYMSPQEMRSAIRKIRSLTSGPFSVNLFVPDEPSQNIDTSAMEARLAPFWQKLTDAPFKAPPMQLPSFDKQLEVLLEEKVPIFSFTFGIPSPSAIERCKKRGVSIFGTATTPEEALLLERAGVDAIVCQGLEAGGHRGTFASPDPFYALFPLLALTKERTKLPLIAAGGIMTGASARAALIAGASAVQLGTAFLTTFESGASATYKSALLQKPHAPTLLTRAFTGKEARAVCNDLTNALQDFEIPAYPLQHFLTQKLRTLAAEKHHPELISLWAGQGYPLCQSISAANLIRKIINEMQ